MSRASFLFLVVALVTEGVGVSAQTSDNVFQSSDGINWSTKDDGLPSQYDDGIIRVNGSYSRDFGPNAHITINHKIDLSGESGISGTSGEEGGSEVTNINGESGTAGIAGGEFLYQGEFCNYKASNVWTKFQSSLCKFRSGIQRWVRWKWR